MNLAELIIKEMESMLNESQATHLASFFQTGKGEYAEGDKFLGIKVPVTRSIVKKYRHEIGLEDIESLISSKWHEVRLAGFLLLIELYKIRLKSKDLLKVQEVVDFYISNIDKGNNWDLVDLVSSNILGDWVLRHPENEPILIELADRNGDLWHQRVAIVATFALIRRGKFDLTFQITEKFLTHSHHLIHKASGWMLREVGKRGGEGDLIKFLERNKFKMPRTMLRYAIEKFPEEKRIYFLRK